MPEEINRLVTDQIADLLLTPSVDGDENLLREGVAQERIFCVGNVMIDTLVRLLPVAEEMAMMERLALQPQDYGLITLHRPSNVDEPAMLAMLMETLITISRDLPLVFPIHPRTRRRLEQLALPIDKANIKLTEPLGYLEFLGLQRHAKLIITDSGGIQEESTYLGVPCLTVRENTERPVTVTIGTNLLVGQNMQRLSLETQRILAGQGKQGAIPPLWDGKAGERVAQILLNREIHKTV
jgi:UDP-N-acetylglucosamine 2-epimerase (non-hydrolysing)